jgi:Fe-S-cluster containining protein
MGKWNCQRCGNCCRWPGIVKVDDHEIAKIADYIKINQQEFIDKFTELRPDRKGLTIISKDDDSCIFLEGKNHCTIQAVKPKQCKEFLVTWFPKPEDNCDAIYTD